MFIYEKDGKLNIMITGGRPADAGVTPDIVIEPVAGTPVTAKISVNGSDMIAILPTASDTVLGGVKVGDGLDMTDGVLSITPEG